MLPGAMPRRMHSAGWGAGGVVKPTQLASALLLPQPCTHPGGPGKIIVSITAAWGPPALAWAHACWPSVRAAPTAAAACRTWAKAASGPPPGGPAPLAPAAV